MSAEGIAPDYQKDPNPYRSPGVGSPAAREAERGWIAHGGRTDPPIAGDTRVRVLFADGTTGEGVMHDWDENWQWKPGGPVVAGNIVAYQTISRGSGGIDSLERIADTLDTIASLLASQRVATGSKPHRPQEGKSE